MQKNTTDNAVATPADSRYKYQVGTLRYTMAGLVIVSGWMIWGGICFNFMQGVFGTLMPLQLNEIKASPMAMTLLISTIPAVLAFVLVPIISFKSDRCRSRWGRRKPFIILTAPFLVIALGLLGYVRQIFQYISAHPETVARFHLSPLNASLVVIGVLVAVFMFFDDFVNSVAWYLVADVIPQNVMGRYNAVAGLIGTGAGMLWNGFVMKYCTPDYALYIYWGVALLYLFGYGLMCLFVKEGEYPPVAADAKRKNRFAGIAVFFQECFGHPMYMALFLFTGAWAITNACGTFRILWSTQTVGLSMAQLGMIGLYCGPITMILAIPVGYVVDRFTPMRVLIAATVLIIPVTLANLLVHNFTSALIVALVNLPIISLWDATTQPLMIQILPKAKYGQFCSANSMVRSIIRICAPIAGAVYVGWMNRRWESIFYWQCGWMLVAFGFLLYLYAQFRKHGGPYNYVAPEPKME